MTCLSSDNARKEEENLDPVTISLAALTVSAVAVAAIAITGKSIIDWFRARARIITSYRRAVAFTVAERINGKKYIEVPGVFGGQTATTRIVQGFYDLEDSKIIEARAIESSVKVQDEEVISAHEAGGGLVIYS
jgi:hypothetical protein